MVAARRIRMIVAAGAAGAALAAAGVASAAPVVHHLGGATRPGGSTPVAVGQQIDPSKVGSANPAFSNGDCEDLANLANFYANNAQEDQIQADANPPGSPLQQQYQADAAHDSAMAAEYGRQLGNNCFVID
jgi:hypothetical protein